MPIKVVRRHSSPNFYLRGTVCGVSVDETTGTDDHAAAEAIRIAREAEILKRSVYGTKAALSFLEAAVMYMEAGGEKRYLSDDRRLIDRLGSLPLARIDQSVIDATARALYPDARPSTINRQVHTPISAVRRFAAKRGLADMLLMERPRQPPGRLRWLTPVEAGKLIDAAAEHLQPLLIFLFATGARLSEALYLDWRDVDLTRRHVAFTSTKSGEARGVPLHSHAVSALANIEHRTGAVFRRPDGRSYQVPSGQRRGGQISTAFNSACRRAGIDDFSPHGCRHTWATWHYAANRDLGALMRLGGWKSERMVLRYAHINVNELADGIAALPLGETSQEWGKSGESFRRKGKTL